MIKKKMSSNVSYRITIDVNLMGKEVSGMDRLLRWKHEGRLTFTQADRGDESSPSSNYNWPGAGRSFDDRPRRFKNKAMESERVNFSTVAGILFPQKNTNKLSMAEINDVAHLIKHFHSKNEIFVTTNCERFIQGGRRERLQTVLGVVVMTPEEAVAMLNKIEGWGESGAR